MILLRRLREIGNLFWGAIFFFVICPLGLFFVLLIPELIIEDISSGISLIKKLDILKGLAIILRPLWASLFLYFNLTLLAFSDEIGDKIVRWFSGK